MPTSAPAKPRRTENRPARPADRKAADEAGGMEGGMATGSAGGPGQEELEEKRNEAAKD